MGSQKEKFFGCENSYTFYLMATGNKNRRKTTVYIEEEFLNLLRKYGYNINTLINYLIEQFLKMEGKFTIPESS